MAVFVYLGSVWCCGYPNNLLAERRKHDKVQFQGKGDTETESESGNENEAKYVSLHCPHTATLKLLLCMLLDVLSLSK
jgi:hypothetical protein